MTECSVPESPMDSAVEKARRILSETPDKWPTRSEIWALARALLSSQSQVERMREALEMAERTLLIASRMLTEDHKMALNGKRWGDHAYPVLTHDHKI